MRRPHCTTIIPGRGKRPVHVERTPLQGFMARSVIAEGQVASHVGRRNGETAVSGLPTRCDAVPVLTATKPEKQPVLSTGPLVDEIVDMVRGRVKFPEILYGDVR